MQVFIKTQSSSTFSIFTKPYHTVNELKGLIREIDPNQFPDVNLKYEAKYLEDHAPLSSYDIKNGAIIHMSVVTVGTDLLRSQGGRFAYKSMKTKSALQENMNSLKNELLEAITDSLPSHQLTTPSLGEQINCIEVSDEENIVLLGTDQGHIIHYDYVEKKTVKIEKQTEQHGVSKIAVASVAGTLAIGAPKGVYVYQQEQGILIAQTLNPVTVIKISRDGDSVYYKKGERTVEKYSVSKAKKELAFNFDGPVKAIVLSNDEKTLILGGFDTPIMIFSTEDASLVHTIPDSRRGTATYLKLTSDDKQLIAAYNERLIKVYNMENDSVHVFRHSHSSEINSIVITPNNKVLFSGSSDGCLTIYDLEKLIVLYYFNNFQEGGIRTMRVTDNGKMLLSAGDKGDLKLYELEQMEEHASINTTHDAINCLANHPSNTYFVAGCKDGTIRIFNNTVGDAERSITDIGGGPVYTIACSHKNGEFIAAGFEDLAIRVFSYITGEFLKIYDAAHTDQITGIAFSADSKFVISSSADRSIKIWETQGGLSSPLYTDTTHTDSIGTMCLSSDGRYLITASCGKNLTVYEFSQVHGKNSRHFEIKKVHAFIDAHDGTIMSIAISSKNKYIVSVGTDYVVKVFDLERHAFAFSFLDYHKAIPKSVIISKKDQYIISIDEDGFVNIFNLTNRKHVYTDVVPNSGKILACIGTAECSKIVTGCVSGKINVLINAFAPIFVNVSCGSISAASTLGYCLLKHFIKDTNSSRKRGEIITKYSNLYIHPFEWNFLHLVCIFAPEIELIEVCIREKIPFLTDHNGYTPLHYLLHFHKQGVTVINYMLGKFGELVQDERDLARAIAALSNQVEEIIRYGKFQAANFLEYAVMQPQRFAKGNLTSFGAIGKKQKSKYMIAETNVFTPELQKELLGHGGDQMLSIKVVGFKFDYGPSSKDMLRLMLFLMDVDNEEIYKTRPVNQIIDYLWQGNKTFFYLPTAIFSAIMIAISVYCGLPVDERPLWLEVFMLASGGVSLLYEAWLLVLESSLYFKDAWNLIDMAVNSLQIATPLVIWTAGNDSLYSQRLLTATLFLGYFRWFSYFRVIDQTRKLTKMIAEVLKDMTSFLVVLVFLTIGFAFIFLQLRPDSTFGSELFKTYVLIYANYEESPEGSEIAYFVIFTVFVSVTLLNMLIAIMNETYGRVQDIRFYYENKTKINLIIEAITAKRFLLRITSKIRKSKLWKRIQLCPARFRNTFAQLHPERGMGILERHFYARSGHLYFAERIEKNEYLHVMETRINRNKTPNSIKIKPIKEEKQSGMDPVYIKNLLREVLEENNEKLEAEKQHREELTNRVNTMEEKFMMMIMDALKDKNANNALPNVPGLQHHSSRNRKESREVDYSHDWKPKHASRDAV